MELLIKKFSEFDSQNQHFFETSVRVREQAYAPFSNFKVGAALLTDDEVIYTGCNVECSSYPMTMCAERTAVVKAVSEGIRTFKSLAVCAIQDENFVAPCGACRQMVAEFVRNGRNLDIYLIKPDKSEVLVTTLKDLLPLTFSM